MASEGFKNDSIDLQAILPIFMEVIWLHVEVAITRDSKINKTMSKMADLKNKTKQKTCFCR